VQFRHTKLLVAILVDVAKNRVVASSGIQLFNQQHFLYLMKENKKKRFLE
jgi:hypothetical protein